MAKNPVGDVTFAHVVAYNPYDATRMGIAALPNAAAESVGGLYTRGAGAGQINQPANGQVDVNVVGLADGVITAVKFAADAITSSTLATSAAQKIRDSILTYALDTGRTVEGYLRKAYAFTFGRVTGQEAGSNTVTVYKADNTTVEHTVAKDDVAGTRQAASVQG